MEWCSLNIYQRHVEQMSTSLVFHNVEHNAECTLGYVVTCYAMNICFCTQIQPYQQKYQTLTRFLFDSIETVDVCVCMLPNTRSL